MYCVQCSIFIFAVMVMKLHALIIRTIYNLYTYVNLCTSVAKQRFVSVMTGYESICVFKCLLCSNIQQVLTSCLIRLL